MKKRSLSKKFIWGLIGLAAALCLMSVAVTAVLYRKRMEDYYAKTAFDAAEIAAQNIDGSRISAYQETLQTDEYYDGISRFLLGLKETVGVKYLYVVIPGQDEMFYIWDVGEPGEEGVCGLGDEDAYYGGGKQVMQAAFAGQDEGNTILITNHREYGYLASAYVPIPDARGNPAALASVDISMDSINREILHFTILILLFTVMILTVFVSAYYLFIKRQVIRPIKRLHLAASTIVKENLENTSDFETGIRTGDEIGELAEAFQYMVGELREYIGNLRRVTAEKERIGAELYVATQIQASMLPCIFPAFPEKKEFDIFATMEPAKEVGGDFYDFFLIGEDRLAVVIADVSGKGVPAALFMVIAKTLIKNHAQAGEEPSAVFEQVNRQLCENNDAGLFVTAWMGILDIKTGVMTCVNAGHNPPLLKQNGTFEYLRVPPGLVLAAMDDMDYGQSRIGLSKGDTLYLYTDGVTEAAATDGSMYGEDRLRETLNRMGERPLSELLVEIREDVRAFAGEEPQYDDITMLALRLQ